MLVVDLDPQGGCAVSLGISTDSLNKTVYTVLMNDNAGFRDVVFRNSHGFNLAPSNIDLAGDIHQQIAMLRNPKTVSREALEEFTHHALERGRDAAGDRNRAEPDNIWNRIRKAEPAIEFIGRYIELTPTATGGVGYCPFHEDQHKSFGVHEKGNYWRCFAGCGGGSIIDFWSAPVKGHRN